MIEWTKTIHLDYKIYNEEMLRNRKSALLNKMFQLFFEASQEMSSKLLSMDIFQVEVLLLLDLMWKYLEDKNVIFF